MPRRPIAGECLAKLLGNPSRRRMLGDMEVDQHSSRVMDGEEYVEHAEGDSGNHEGIHRGDDLAVVGENDAPSSPASGVAGRRSM